MTSTLNPNNFTQHLANGGTPTSTSNDSVFLSNLLRNATKDQQELLTNYQKYHKYLKGKQLSAASVLYPQEPGGKIVYLKYDEASGKMRPRLAENHLEDYRKTVLDLFTKEGLEALNGNQKLTSNQEKLYNDFLNQSNSGAPPSIVGINKATTADEISDAINHFRTALETENITIPKVELPKDLGKTGVSFETMAQKNDNYKGIGLPHSIDPNIFAPSLRDAGTLMAHSNYTQICEKATETQLIQYLKNEPELTTKLSEAIKQYKTEIGELKTLNKGNIEERNKALEKLGQAMTGMFSNPLMFGLKLLFAIAFPFPCALLFIPDLLKISVAGFSVVKNTTEVSDTETEIHEIEKNIEKLAFLINNPNSSSQNQQQNPQPQNPQAQNPATHLASLTGGGTPATGGPAAHFKKLTVRGSTM